ncbi:hypothetical protein VB002_01000 [Campylobacter concisus]
MKRIIVILSLFFGFAFGADFSLNEYRTPLISVESDGTATIVDSPEILIGSEWRRAS